MEWHTIENLPDYMGVALFLYWLVVLAVMVCDQRDPSKTLAWLLILFVLPLVGLVLYFFLGRNWKRIAEQKGLHEQLQDLARPCMSVIHSDYTQFSRAARDWAAERGWLGLTAMMQGTDIKPPLPAQEVQILPGGAEKFARLKQDLAQARETINIQYFIWERDQLSAELISILQERIAAGVQVRILNDFIGNLFSSKTELRQLARAGAKVFFDVRQISKANYRNHRKIVVIDGIQGYTGGINVGQEYIDGGRRYPAWRDTHVCFRGPAVAELQKLFALRWFSATRENLFRRPHFPESYPAGQGSIPAQVVSTSVEDKWETARRAHVLAISRARSRVWIQTPYFVPDEEVYGALINAALCGVDVRLMITGWPDKKSAWYAAHSYFGLFMEAGGRVFLYNRGFFHSKTISVDSTLLAIGSMNMDIRSLKLHQELMVWFLDQELARQHEGIFQADLHHCTEYTLQKLHSLPKLAVLRNSVLRLASSLL